MLQRDTRYQAAIVQSDQLLLLRVVERDSNRSFWVIPGGGREQGESEEACVRREVREETSLAVEVLSLLLDEPLSADETYTRAKTYLCRVTGGQARPGVEPEVDSPEHSTIREVGWFKLDDPASWHPLALQDRVTYPLLMRVRAALGYPPVNSGDIV